MQFIRKMQNPEQVSGPLMLILHSTWAFYLCVNLAHTKLPLSSGGSALALWLVTAVYLWNRWRLKESLGSWRDYPATLWYLAFSIWLSATNFWTFAVWEGSDVQENVWRLVGVVFCLEVYLRRKGNLSIFFMLLLLSTSYFGVLYLATSPIATWGDITMGGITSQWRNAAGYYACFAAMLGTYVAVVKRYRTWPYVVFLIAFALITGSRKVILHLGLGVLFLILFNWAFVLRIPKKYLIGGLIVLVLAVAVAYQIPQVKAVYGSRLLALINFSIENSSRDERIFFITKAWEMFVQRPLQGWGIDNFRSYLEFQKYWNVTYSHNNYTELLANYGLVGFVLFYWLPVRRLLEAARNLRKSSFAKFLFSLLTIYLILDVGTISYYYRITVILLVSLMTAVRQETQSPGGSLSDVEAIG